VSPAPPLPARIEAVAIGASAGGVEALSTLLPALPEGLRASVFVVLHLPRDRPSRLADIFQTRCVLPVVEAQDKEPVAPGTVYIAPPDYHLLLDHGPRIALSTDEPVNYSRPAIDVLFESAADVYRDRLLGMILTGGNHDGTAGLVAVQRHRGTTVVQAPESAQVPLMPASALQRVAPDHVLPLPAIAELLRGLRRAPT
jgi:two-component system chemotaxis response regulator CheB